MVNSSPQISPLFTPTSSSWLKMVERLFRDIEELIMAIAGYIDKHDDNPKPFVWTAKAADILEKARPQSNRYWVICLPR